jgi:Putative endonuclease, protein of unknown function (DUF1780)
MATPEQRVLDELARDAAEAASLFSNAGQALQERTAVAGLLRVFGIDFRNSEIEKRGPEPIDIWFRDARFQITEMLDTGRPRNLEVRQRSKRMSEAKSLQQLIEPGTISSQPISPSELVTLALERAKKKEQKYGDCRYIDLLIYVNLRQRHIFPTSPFPNDAEASLTGWRSVSIIMERFAIVLWASAKAPEFIIERKGRPLTWDKIDSVFLSLE